MRRILRLNRALACVDALVNRDGTVSNQASLASHLPRPRLLTELGNDSTQLL